jgi:CHAT domain-containing protein/Tfp pilus assembly protein PilF
MADVTLIQSVVTLLLNMLWFSLIPAALHAATDRSPIQAPPAQAGTVEVRNINASDQTICYEMFFSNTYTQQQEDALYEIIIAPDEQSSFQIESDNYNVGLGNCDGNLLLLKQNFVISTTFEIALTSSVIATTQCQLKLIRGSEQYSSGDYYEASIQLEAALRCYQDVGDLSGEALTLAGIGLIYQALGRSTEALKTYTQALKIVHQINDRDTEDILLNNIAYSYDALGQYTEALAYYQQSLIITRQIGNRSSEALTLTNIGVLYNKQGFYAKALEYHQQALAIMRALGEQASIGSALVNIGSVYHDQGRYDEALSHYQEALKILHKEGNRMAESAALNNIALTLSAQGNKNEALTYYQQALAIVRKVGNRIEEGATLHNIAGIHFDQGIYAEALATYQQALTIRRSVSDRLGEASTLSGIGLVYHTQARYMEALAFYQQALAIRQEIGDRAGEALTLNNIGGIYAEQTHLAEALSYYQQALVIRQEIGDHAGEAVTLNNIGGILIDQERYSAALRNYQQALAIRQEVGDRAGEATTLHNIGFVYSLQGDDTQALVYYRQALAIRREVGDQLGEARTLANMGASYDTQGALTDALRTYDQALAIIETIRSTAGSEEGRTSFINQYSFLYNRMIELYTQQQETSLAFTLTERGRARAFLDSLATGQVELTDNVAADLLAQENQAYSARQAAQETLAKAKALNPPDPALVADLEVQLGAAESAYNAALSSLQTHQARLSDLVAGRNENVLTLAAAQKQIDNQTTLISYWMLTDKTVAFVITADDTVVVELPDATTENLQNVLSSLYQWRNTETPYPRPLRSLYSWLMAPLKEYILTPNVTIIPHQALHYVPFAALTDGEYYVGQQYILSLLPSASVLPFLAQNGERTQAHPNYQALVFGNPETALSALPAAAAEAQAVAGLLATTAYTGRSASEMRLRANLTGTRVLHIAAHGEYNVANPLSSAIVLAATEHIDGRLEAHEIFSLSFQGNDLVVLSACQTNLNELTDSNQIAVSRGDEIVGLTRAFFFAGSPTVISSLWNVDDVATETLMVSFYKHWLQEGLSKAQALQAAQADVRADPRWASPFYWAGFVLNGDPGEPTR